MYFSNQSRRFFLQGLAGAALALPFLPSMIRTGQAAPVTKKRFFAITNDHGVFEEAWFPADYKASKDYTLPVNQLPLSTYAGDISSILGAGFTPLKDKLTLMRGLDCMMLGPQEGGHDQGFTLAGTSFRDQVTSPRGKSIDVLLSESPHVYPDGPPRFPHLSVCMSYVGHSFTVKDGKMVTSPAHANPRALFDLLFGGGVSDAETPEQKTERLRQGAVVHSVFSDYQRLQNSGRISAADKLVLQEHMELVRGLERRFVDDPNAVRCADLSGDTYSNYTNIIAKDYDERYDQLFDVVILATKCGLTNVVHLGLPTSETSNTTDVEDAIYRHLDTPDLKFNTTIHSYSHAWQSARPQMLRAQQWLAGLAAKFMSKLDAVENSATGETYLETLW